MAARGGFRWLQHRVLPAVADRAAPGGGRGADDASADLVHRCDLRPAAGSAVLLLGDGFEPRRGHRRRLAAGEFARGADVAVDVALQLPQRQENHRPGQIHAGADRSQGDCAGQDRGDPSVVAR